MEKFDINRYVRELEKRIEKPPKKQKPSDGTDRAVVDVEKKQHPLVENITSTYIRWK